MWWLLLWFGAISKNELKQIELQPILLSDSWLLTSLLASMTQGSKSEMNKGMQMEKHKFWFVKLSEMHRLHADHMLLYAYSVLKF